MSDKKSKWLCNYSVEKEIEVVEESKSETDADGKETIVSTKTKKNVPVGLKLLKPNRKLLEDGEMYYAVKLSEGVKAGLLTRTQIAKRYDDDGGIFTDSERKRRVEIFDLLLEQERALFGEEIKTSEKTQEQKEGMLTEILLLRKELEDMENSYQYIFEQTAENKARNKTIMWWTLNLAYIKNENDEEYQRLFGEGTFDDKLTKYEDMEESLDKHIKSAMQKSAFLVSYWYISKNTTPEDFKRVEENFAESFSDAA